MIAPSSRPSPPRAAFLASLQASGLLTDEQFFRAVADLPAEARTGRAAAAALVAAGVLTRFQAGRLLAGRSAGFVLGPYVVLDQTGRGPGGRAYRALHRAMNRPVALRVLPADRARDPEALRAQARSVGRLAHPNVVTMLDADEYGGRFVLVQEHAEGAGADAAVRESGPLPVSRACEVARQAALGLQHAHEKGVCHGALTPGCLLVGRAAVKVAGFGPGLAEAVGDPADYRAPELFGPAAVPTPLADLYALGGVLYYLLTGRTPFPAVSAQDKARHHRESEPVPVEVLRPEVPPPVAALVRELLAKDPTGRPATAGDVAARLDPFGESAGEGAWGEGYRPGDADAMVLTPRPCLTLAGSTLAGDTGSLAELSPWSGITQDGGGPTGIVGRVQLPAKSRHGMAVAVGVALVLAVAMAVITVTR